METLKGRKMRFLSNEDVWLRKEPEDQTFFDELKHYQEVIYIQHLFHNQQNFINAIMSMTVEDQVILAS